MGSMDDSRMYKRQKRKEKHLYLVLDDWDKGFTIRKIDADSPDDHRRSLLDEPPVIRLLSPNPIHRMAFAALGSSHVLAASNKHPATLVYDTDTAGLITGPPVPDALQDAYKIFLPADDNTMYAFAYFLDEPRAVEVLSSTTNDDLHSSVPTMDWSWRSTAPSPFTQYERICSYAAHPDGRTIFLSACTMFGCVHQSVRTLSFDTGRSEWTAHGDWALPFMDRGHFDSYLDAWVGLHEDGYVGACQVASPAPAGDMKMPRLEWIWRCPPSPAWAAPRFCLVGCVVREGMRSGYTAECVLNVTTFHLRYSHKGELQIFERATRSCQMYKERLSFSPVAFWM
ncbi:hypothetical protein VPH35_110057 [Triticum aestivum]